MPNTKAEIGALGLSLAGLPIPCRVQVFNTIVPWVRAVCPRYRIIDFYEVVFFSPYKKETAEQIGWDNVTGTVVLKESRGS